MRVDTPNEPLVDSLGGWSTLLDQIVARQDLTIEQGQAAMADILAGRATDAQLAGLMVGLRMKGEAPAELVGLAKAMLDAARPLTLPAGTVDIVGTGGSARRRKHALNVSTMASFVAAGAGVTVCKHGNKKASSTSGSFDFLESLGIGIDIEPDHLERCLESAGIGFAFARTFHPAMRFVGPPRSQLGIQTIFNYLGPLAHPGRPAFQVVGTSSVELASKMAQALVQLDVDRAWVVAGHDGYDELTLSGPSHVFDVSADGIGEMTVRCEDVGLRTVGSTDELAGGQGQQNVEIFSAILSGKEKGPKRDIVVLNAAAALVVAGHVETLPEAVHQSIEAIETGKVAQKVEDLKVLTNT